MFFSGILRQSENFAPSFHMDSMSHSKAHCFRKNRSRCGNDCDPIPNPWMINIQVERVKGRLKPDERGGIDESNPEWLCRGTLEVVKQSGSINNTDINTLIMAQHNITTNNNGNHCTTHNNQQQQQSQPKLNQAKQQQQPTADKTNANMQNLATEAIPTTNS